MKVLLVLYVYPPLLAPATMCYVKLALALRRAGHDVEVVTVDLDSFELTPSHVIDPQLEVGLPPGITNHRIRSRENWLIMRAVRRIGALRTLCKGLFEPRKREWVSPAIRYLSSACFDLKKFDLLITCSQPHANHLVGHSLKRRTGLPWIAYFSDPWTDFPWEREESETIRRYNLKLERQVVEDCDCVLFTSEETTRLVMKKYSEEKLLNKSGELPHCFVPEWYGLGDPPFRRAKAGGVLQVVHTGHFYGARTPRPLFESLARVNRVHPLASRLRFVLFGIMPPEDRTFLADEGLSDVVVVREPVPYFVSLGALRQADALLLIDAKTMPGEESVFLPSKLVDYLGAERPILGITPSAGASARTLRQTGHKVVDVADGAAIDKAITELILKGVNSLLEDEGACKGGAIYGLENFSAQLEGFMQQAIENAKQ